MSITHSFVSVKSDGGDATLVRPSDWNDDHVIAGFNAAFIGASVSNTTPQAITTGGSGEAITFDTELFDTDGFHSTVTNTSRFTIPAGLGGKYLLLGGGGFADPENSGVVFFAKNGSPDAVQTGGGSATTARKDSQAVEVINLVAGDYVELWAFHSAGADRDFGTGVLSYFRIVKLDSGKVGSGIGASAWNSATQTITDNTSTALTFDSEDFDTDGFHSTSVNTERMTVPAGLGGLYLVVASTYVSNSDADNVRAFTIRKNGTDNSVRVLNRSNVINTNDNQGMHVTAIVQLAAGDYVDAAFFQNSGSSLSVGFGSVNSAQSSLSIARLDSGASSTPPFHSVATYKAADLAVSTSGEAALQMDSEVWDTDGYHDNSTNNERFTVPTGLGGYYEVGINARVSSGINAYIACRKNGSTILMLAAEASAGGPNVGSCSSTTLVNLSAGDYVEFKQLANSAGSILNTNGTQAWCWMRLVG